MALVKKLDLTHGVRTLAVFVPSSRESYRGNDAAVEAMSLVLARLQEDKRFTEKVRPYFGFTTLDFLKEDFRVWFDFEGERMEIF